jgi:tetratricopeptide (TPR) repeat protein
MGANKCVACSRVKGKRVCRIRAGALICPQCCAQIRGPDCRGCVYYSQAEEYARKKTLASQAKGFMMRVDPEVDEKVDQALAMIESGNGLDGESIIADLLAKHPDLHTVQYAMGVVLAKKGKYQESILHFDKAIEIFPYFVEAWFNKGISYQKLVKPDETIRAFRKVIELGNATDDFVRYARSMVNDVEQRLHESDGITLDDYLKAKDKFDEAFSMMEKRQWQPAISGFQAAIRLSPSHPQSYGNMGICYAQLGRRQEALEALDKALALDPNYGPALVNRKIVASLKEGEKLPDDRFSSVEYYKDYALKHRSMLERLAGIFRT